MTADPNDLTLATYQTAAQRYIDRSVVGAPAVLAFLDGLADLVGDGWVLELGSGPGTDAAYLEQRGVRVLRTDATPAFVQRLRDAGHDARTLDARRDDFGGPYNAVLANAVLLHLSRSQFAEAIRRARASARPAGVLAITLKEGDGERWSTAKLDRPRHFTFWREPAVRSVLESAGWTDVVVDHVVGRAEQWLYVIARAG